MKLTMSMLIITGLFCSCAPRTTVIGQITSGIHHQGRDKPDLSMNHTAIRNARHAAGKSAATSPAHPASAQMDVAGTQPVGYGERTIDAFVVTGNTRMSTEKIQSAIKQYRGEHKTGEDVSNAMRSVIDLYSSSGLNGAIITKKDHVVVLHVIEASINAGSEAGLDSGGRHYSTAIKISPVSTATAQSAPSMHDGDQPAKSSSNALAYTPATTGTYFVIKGNHRVSTTEIQQILKPYTGRRFSRNDLFMAKLSLTDLYESKGLHHVAIGIPAVSDNPVMLTIYENDIGQTAVATTMHRKETARLSSKWFQLGWKKVEKDDIKQAIDIWQQGVNRMAPDRLLAYIGVYTQISAAIRRLKQVGFMQAAIILKTNFHGKSAYYVMSALHVPVDKTLRRKKLAGLRRAMGQPGSIHASSAGKFQTTPDLSY